MSHTSTTALVLLGGDAVDPADQGALPSDAFVVAADSGIDQAHLLGRRVDLAVGDFDSVSAAGLSRARAEGAEVHVHPPAKSSTDFELALDAVAARGIRSAVVAGGEGGRLDHLISNALVMSSDRFADLEITAVGRGGARLHVVRGSRLVPGEPGEYVTLMAVHGPADGVTTDGLRFPLVDDRLEPGSSRGVSNELLVPLARIDVASGVVLAILPGHSHAR